MMVKMSLSISDSTARRIVVRPGVSTPLFDDALVSAIFALAMPVRLFAWEPFCLDFPRELPVSPSCFRTTLMTG